MLKGRVQAELGVLWSACWTSTYFTLIYQPCSYPYTSSRVKRLLCSDSAASPSEWLLNPGRSIRAPKASEPHPGMRWQKSGENPGENCEEERLNVLLTLLFSGNHLGGGSKPKKKKLVYEALCRGKSWHQFHVVNCHTSLLFGPLLMGHLWMFKLRESSVCPTAGGWQPWKHLCWSSLTSSGSRVETQTKGKLSS